MTTASGRPSPLRSFIVSILPGPYTAPALGSSQPLSQPRFVRLKPAALKMAASRAAGDWADAAAGADDATALDGGVAAAGAGPVPGLAGEAGAGAAVPAAALDPAP